jgi:hypothetical protein
MGTTPIYKLPYVESSDAISTYPTTGKANAQAVETAISGVAALGNPAVRVARSKTAPQVITTAGTFYTLTYETDEANGTGYLDYFNGVFTVPTAGVYLIAVTQHVQSTGGLATFKTYIGGTLRSTFVYQTPANASCSFVLCWRMAADQTIYVNATHNIANSTMYGGSSTRYSYIDITRVAA